ncbi:MAG: cysteine--tRNA ligase [Gemmatimonadota bacterium]
MTLRLYNTQTRTVEPLVPLHPPRVGVYGCGPTVYGAAHIGNFRTFLVFDLVHRYLEWRGFQVRFVMNLTDVDDKTIQAAQAAGQTIQEYTEPFVTAFHADAEALGMRPFHAYPRATAYVDEMVDLVRRLLEKGLAYTTEDGSVFFRIAAFSDYGKLSGKDLEAMQQGERVSADEYGKEDPRDFALWKGAKEGDREAGAVWGAPWGEGRPGWHLECSAMGLAEVGETLDLHLGGEDLIFPHHEDELAQSEGATGKPFVRCWLHVKHLRVDGAKMSKSLRNVFTVRELLDEGVEPAALRHQLLSAHYRSELNFTRAGLDASARAVRRVADFRARLREYPVERDGSPAGSLSHLAREARHDFQAAMDDDLNVPEALAALFVFVNRGNASLEGLKGAPIPESHRDLALETLTSLDEVLGFLELVDGEVGPDADLSAWVEERLAARQVAREARDFSEADRIRDELQERGVVLEDSPKGTRWKMRG